MKQLLLILFTVFSLLACESSKVEQEISAQIEAYDQVAKKSRFYFAKMISEYDFISVQFYDEVDEIMRIEAHHMIYGTLEFKRNIYLKNEELLFAHYVGLAPEVNVDKYLIFNERYYFESPTRCHLHKAQQIEEDFLEANEVIAKLKEVPSKEEVTFEDYKRVMAYYKGLLAHKPKQ